MYLSKTLYHLLSVGIYLEKKHSNMTEKILAGTLGINKNICWQFKPDTNESFASSALYIHLLRQWRITCKFRLLSF